MWLWRLEPMPGHTVKKLHAWRVKSGRNRSLRNGNLLKLTVHYRRAPPEKVYLARMSRKESGRKFADTEPYQPPADDAPWRNPLKDCSEIPHPGKNLCWAFRHEAATTGSFQPPGASTGPKGGHTCQKESLRSSMSTHILDG